MLKKRIVCSILMICLVLVFSACGQKSDEPVKQVAPEKKVETKAEAKAEPKAEPEKKLDYPKKPIKIICPWSPGGSSDSMLRAFSAIGEKYLGKTLVVVNRDGAGGTIATTEVKSNKPDGYTILLDAVGVFTTQPKLREVSYTLDDFETVVGLSYEPIVLAVNTSSRYESLEDLKNAGKTIKFGGNAVGSLPHIAGMDVFGQAGIEAEHVPFKGGAPSITALLGNHVDVAAAHPGELIPHVENGDLKFIGICSPERYDLIKDVPTFNEQGLKIDYSVWKFILTPKGLDPEIRDFLETKFKEMMKDPEFVKFAENNNIKFRPISGEQVRTDLSNQVEATSNAIDLLGLKKN